MMYTFQSELGIELERIWPQDAEAVAKNIERFLEWARKPHRRRAFSLDDYVPTAEEIFQMRGLEPLVLIAKDLGVKSHRLVCWAGRERRIPHILLAADWKGVRREYLFGNRKEILAILRANTPSEENTTLNGTRLVQSSRLAERIGVPRQRLVRLAHAGRFSFKKIGRVMWVDGEAAKAYLEEKDGRAFGMADYP